MDLPTHLIQHIVCGDRLPRWRRLVCPQPEVVDPILTMTMPLSPKLLRSSIFPWTRLNPVTLCRVSLSISLLSFTSVPKWKSTHSFWEKNIPAGTKIDTGNSLWSKDSLEYSDYEIHAGTGEENAWILPCYAIGGNWTWWIVRNQIQGVELGNLNAYSTEQTIKPKNMTGKRSLGDSHWSCSEWDFSHVRKGSVLKSTDLYSSN